MKYKTLCRLLVRILGVYFIAEGMTYVPVTIRELIESEMKLLAGYSWAYVLGDLVPGVILLWMSRRITDWLIPANRPYCHECGYDLTGAAGHVCPECGTAFRADPATEPHH